MEAWNLTEWDVSIVYEAESIHQKYVSILHICTYTVYMV